MEPQLSELERAAWSRGDMDLADLYGALMDADARVEPEALQDVEDERDAARTVADDATARVGVLEVAADRAYNVLHDLAQRVEVSKRVPKAELLAAIREATAHLVVE